MSARRTILLSTALLATGLGAAPGVAQAQSGDGLMWSITPYLWGTNTKVDLTYRDRDLASQDISFGDLLDIMDAAFMVNVEAGRGQWSAFADLTYLKTSDKDKRQFTTINVSSEQVFLDAALAFWPSGLGTGFSVFGGIRYTGMDDKFRVTLGDLQPRKIRSNKDYADALLGLRYRWDLAPRWSLLLHGDGSFGSSEGTWLLRGVFGYTVGQREMNKILFGYQYKAAEFEDHDLGLDFTYYGPVAGFSFRF